MLGGVAALFEPDMPRWAVELTETHVVAVSLVAAREQVASKAIVPLPPGLLEADDKERNIVDGGRLRDSVQDALSAAGFSGSDIALVIPDDAVRIALLSVDALPGADLERKAIIRWKLKKTVPFNVDSARVAYQTIGQDGGIDLVVALARPGIADQYEEIMDSLGLHAGIVSPSTVAVLNLLGDSAGDTLLVKKNQTSVTTSLLMEGRLRFYRKVSMGQLISLGQLFDAVYPTLMYYQDKLHGGGLREAFICGEDIGDPDELASRLGVGMRRLHYGQDPSDSDELAGRLSVARPRFSSAALEDVYLPAVGVLQQ